MQGCGGGADDKFAWYGGILGYLLSQYSAISCTKVRKINEQLLNQQRAIVGQNAKDLKSKSD